MSALVLCPECNAERADELGCPKCAQQRVFMRGGIDEFTADEQEIFRLRAEVRRLESQVSELQAALNAVSRGVSA